MSILTWDLGLGYPDLTCVTGADCGMGTLLAP